MYKSKPEILVKHNTRGALEIIKSRQMVFIKKADKWTRKISCDSS